MRTINKSNYHFLVKYGIHMRHFKTAKEITASIGIPKSSIYNIIDGKCQNGRWADYVIEKCYKPIYTITEIKYDHQLPKPSWVDF
tara:strand:- start:60 stop:314 length:255 start_codon:yes stop_codon:yes gene_type:complete